jgi:hypothetical protein
MRREFDRVSLGFEATEVDDALSERSSTSEELATEFREVAVLSSRLLGLRTSGVVVAINHLKSANEFLSDSESAPVTGNAPKVYDDKAYKA